VTTNIHHTLDSLTNPINFNFDTFIRGIVVVLLLN
jgi:hypothetical protein